MKTIATLLCIILLPAIVPAQQLRGLRSNSQSDLPRLQWWTNNLNDTLRVKVFRAPHNEETFTEIQTWQTWFYVSDTLVVEITDTTLARKGIWQYYLEAHTRDGKTILSDILFAHNLGYLAPPEVLNLRTRPARDTRAIELQWEVRNPSTIVSQNLFRSHDFDEGYQWVTRLPAHARSYTDEVPRANEPWFYFIVIQDFFGYQPAGIRVHGFATFAEKPFAPSGFVARREQQDVVLSWSITGENIFGYRIYRRENGTGGFSPLGGPFYLPGKDLMKTDLQAIGPETRSLEYYMVSISDGYIESAPTDTLILYIEENLVVAPPPELDCLVQNDGTVLLLWSPAPDFSGIMGYNVYRAHDGEEYQRLNPSPLAENRFVDQHPPANREISYQVESINPGGKPSSTRTTSSLQHHPPQIKLVLSCRQVRSGIQLEWVPLKVDGIRGLQILRQENNEEPVLLTRIANERGTYTDTRTSPETSYVYIMVAEMTDGRLIVVNDGVVVSRH
ncbi:MAG: hypothetical protein ACK4VN_10000 [Bacteroidales bacterium]